MLRALFWAILLTLPTLASAQNWRTRLTVTGHPLVSANPTGAEFEAGFVVLGATLYTVETQTGVNGATRTATLSLSCQLPCPASGATPLAGLAWRRADLPNAWTQLTTSNVAVEQRVMTRGTINDSWSNSLEWRLPLGWLTHPPGVQTSFNIILTLTVVVP